MYLFIYLSLSLSKMDINWQSMNERDTKTFIIYRSTVRSGIFIRGFGLQALKRFIWSPSHHSCVIFSKTCCTSASTCTSISSSFLHTTKISSTLIGIGSCPLLQRPRHDGHLAGALGALRAGGWHHGAPFGRWGVLAMQLESNFFVVVIVMACNCSLMNYRLESVIGPTPCGLRRSSGNDPTKAMHGQLAIAPC